MKQYSLKVSSNNEKSLKNFLNFFFKYLKPKFNALQKSVVAGNKRHTITLLKSPHVNKTAQEHFESRVFSKKILLKSGYLERDLIFLKSVINQLFQDVSSHLEFLTNNFNKEKSISHPDNFTLPNRLSPATNFKRERQKLAYKKFNSRNNPLLNLTAFLNAYSIFGELLITAYTKQYKNCLNSSAVEQRTENPCVGSSNLPSDKNKLIMKNYLWNMFANIQNGQASKRSVIFQKRKKVCEAVLKVLWAEGFILGYKIDGKDQNLIKIFLKYNKNKPAIHSIKSLSKPSRRLYYSAKQIWKLDSNKSLIVFSTNQGLKSILECKKLRIGGEPFVIVN